MVRHYGASLRHGTVGIFCLTTFSALLLRARFLKSSEEQLNVGGVSSGVNVNANSGVGGNGGAVNADKNFEDDAVLINPDDKK